MSSPGTRTILGHPPGLFILFFTEMWERFSFYGMRSLLVLYMVDHLFLRPDVGQNVLGFAAIKGALESIFGPLAIQPLSSQIYGLYTAFVYLTPFFGGMLADRVLGQRKTVILGAILMAIGHFLMAIETAFFVALMFLILGNGAFKPNISTQVGGLYPAGDPRRDRAFTIFYMGINLGAFFSPLICGTLGQRLGWHYGFGAAGVGMILGLCLYLWGQKHLAADNVMKTRGKKAEKTRLTRDEWKGIGALALLCALNIVFWGVYEQQGNTMQLWADRNTNWNLLGFQIPSTWYQSFNPLMIFIFAPLLNVVWAWQSRRKKEPTSVIKMAIGCFLLGASYVIMILAAQGVAPDQRRNVMWLVGTTFVLTIGELYLSPIGLSLVTKVAPARMVSMMMGVWFLSSFFGNYLSGFLGTFWEKMPRDAFFLMLTLLGLGAGVAMFLFSRPVDRIIGKHERPAS
ncbi:MAG: peptide MFS transporter [Candidatus Eisenbacteria bacterium]|nr:peptide MFS transporter [Candidatus Eisenbacteria bacterium]